MPGSCLPLPLSKRRHHECRFRKQAAELNSAAAAAAVFSDLGFLSAGPAGFLFASLVSSLSTGFADSSEPTAAASAPGGNSIRNRVEFCNLG